MAQNGMDGTSIITNIKDNFASLLSHLRFMQQVQTECFVLMTRCCCFRPSPPQLLEPTLEAIIFALTESRLIETGDAY